MRQKLPITVLERIDDLCVEFEQNWQSNEPPSIESIVEGEDASIQREVLLAELIVLEVDYRRLRGEKPTLQEYLARFPDDTKAVQDALKEDDKPSGAFQPPSVDDLAKLFPALQIIELIGAGGMGAVYKARQEGLDRVVALKILPEEFSHDVKFALRFTREARTLAKLNHPNIVSVYEFGNAEDTYYFLMEYVEGSNLRDAVRARQLAPEHALAIVPHLCDALQYAHDKNVVHRDIKPENILLATDGSVKIADFGLSRILGNDGQSAVLTRTNQVMGTPRYMAPEQLEGSHRVDHRADIYSLGVVFYEMLTGELPIGRFAAPSQKVEIDVRLDEVVLRTLEKEPQRRYQRVSQVKTDVESIATSENPALAPTLISDVSPSSDSDETVSLEQQELAGRLLLTRQQLMSRVESSLRPLLRGQAVQISLGVLLIVLGAQCWARNIGITHRVVCGAILHVYGILVIAQGANICTRIKRIDFSKPVDEIHKKLDQLMKAYLWTGMVIGFPWWLLWIPVCVAIGFDAVLYPTSLIVSLVVGVVGFLVCSLLYIKTIFSPSKHAVKWREQFSSGSIRNAYLALEEIEQAKIR